MAKEKQPTQLEGQQLQADLWASTVVRDELDRLLYSVDAKGNRICKLKKEFEAMLYLELLNTFSTHMTVRYANQRNTV